MKFFGLFILLLILKPLLGQEKDFQLWTSFEIGGKIYKKLDFSFEEEARFTNNASQIKKYYSQPGISYKISKKLSATIAYRYINQYKTDRTISSKYYYIAEVSYSNKFDRLRFKTRTRYAAKYSRFVADEGLISPQNYLRQKFDFKYNLNKSPFSPFVSFEIFFPLNNPFSNYADTYRTAIGTDYKINKKQSVSISLLNDLEINVEEPLNAWVIALKYGFEF